MDEKDGIGTMPKARKELGGENKKHCGCKRTTIQESAKIGKKKKSRKEKKKKNRDLIREGCHDGLTRR